MLTAVVASALAAMAVWTQSRMGGQLLPHAFCLSSSQPLLKLHLISGALVALAYLLIPLVMLNFVRQRKDVPFGWIAWVFGAFIFACGVTHALDIWTLYQPVYWYAGIAKAFTALISLATAWLIYKLTPLAVAIPSARQLSEANAALNAEIALRRKAEAELMEAKSKVEFLLLEASVEARRSTAVLDRFFEAAPLGMALMDAELRVLRVNGMLSQITRRPSAEYSGHPALSELENMPPALLHAANEVRATGIARRGVEVERTDRSDVVVKCEIFPIEIEGGDPLIGTVVADISAERALANERKAALAAAEEADQRKTEFLAVLAHELRNPLAPVRTATEVLKRSGTANDPRSAKMIATLERQVMHMSRLIDDLLDISRIERGTIECQPVQANMAEIVQQVCHDYEDNFSAMGTVLRVETEDPIPVFGDRVRLAQCVGNYLHNAATYAPGGEVTVIAMADTESREAVVRVTDSGKGIAPELLPNLFKPFVQGEQALDRATGGLGLGLALVKRLVEMHGGRVGATSPGVGKGATFELRIPLLDSPR